MSDYDELVGRAERGELPEIADTVLTGAAAAAAGRPARNNEVSRDS
ncbi:MAG TPA: hypothetical protein VIJ18_11320 [Microbacteriaceae bacterium]